MQLLENTYQILIALLVLQTKCSWSLSDKRLCADPNCQKVISLAKASLTYSAPEVGLISFKINSKIRVKSKSAGNNPDLWGIEVNGREGYAPKKFLVEEKIFVSDKDLNHIVDVNSVQTVNVPKKNVRPSEGNTDIRTETIPTTAPLTNVETPHLLNASENEIKPTTAPLAENLNSQIVNESLKQTATPVLDKSEVIDGTTISYIEEEQKEVKADKKESDKHNTQDSSALDSFNEKINQTTDPKIDTSTNKPEATTIGGILKEEIPVEKLKVQEEDTNLEQSISANNNLKKLAEENTETLKIALKNETHEDQREINKQNNDKEIKNLSIEDSIKTKDNIVQQLPEETNEKKSTEKLKSEEVPIEKPDNQSNEKNKSGSNVSLDAYYDDDYGDDDDEEDDEDLDDDEDSKEILFKSASVSLPMPETTLPPPVPVSVPDAVTESGYFSEPNFVRESEESEHTTPIPKTVPVEVNDAEVEIETDLNNTQSTTLETSHNNEATNITEAADKTEQIKQTESTPSTSYASESSVVLKESEESENMKPKTVPVNVNDAEVEIETDLNSTQSTTLETSHTTEATKITEAETESSSSRIEETVTTPVPTPQVPLQTPKLPLPSQPSEDVVIPQPEKKVEIVEIVPEPKEEEKQPNSEQQNIIEEKQEINNEPKFENESEKEKEHVYENQEQQNNENLLNEQVQNREEHRQEHRNENENVEKQQQQEQTNEGNQVVEEKQNDQVYDPYHINNPHQHQHLHQQPQNVDNQKEERFNYHDPNDYYRLKNEEEIALKPLEAITAQQPSEPATQTQTYEPTTPAATEKHEDSIIESSTVAPYANDEATQNVGTGSIEMVSTPSSPLEVHNSMQEINEVDSKEQFPKDEKAGLFGTILGTVNNFVGKLHKDPQVNKEKDENEELQRILYPQRFAPKKPSTESDHEFCEKISPHNCPQQKMDALSGSQTCHYEWSNLNMDNFVEVFVTKAFEMRELLSCLAIVGSTTLLFLFGYYCFCNSSREGALISKLNLLERSLLASHKENAILKDDLFKTRHKLTSIEDNSFGSNDMVMALKKELETMTVERQNLQQEISSLEKELETAAEAGLELNKIVAELLNNQSGQESMIMNSVEDLQVQFNEQQKTILEINANLAEKSRENSELQLMLAEQNARFSGEVASLQQDNDELEVEKGNLQTRLEELKTEFDEDLTTALEGKNAEVKRLQNEIIDLKNHYEDMHTKWQTSLAKIEALEDCMKTLKKDPSVNINEVISMANVRAELLDLQKQRLTLKNRLSAETEARQHAENGLQTSNAEIDKLKQDFNQSEKDKLEAQTRLEVLSNYFKEKETQLQKELSLKEAIWLKQQGENTSTVDRLTSMQEEIQSLKSQNDELRAEIEAQLAAHKAQTGTLENRAHETWLAARQSERRFEEARAEAAALRRRLTELAGGANMTDGNRGIVDGKITAGELNNAPSPIMPPPMMDPTANSPLLGRLPPPPFMPFMGPPPPPFLNLPPPPFLSSVEMRPAPLGRMMSPPLGRYSPPPVAQAHRERDRIRDRDRERERDRSRDRYHRRRNRGSDFEDDDEYDDGDVDGDDYDEYDYDEEDDDAPSHRRTRRLSGNGSDSWRRDTYSPPPPDRSYRSHSPTDSRYNYTADRELMSTYDTETDLSPPPSPRGHRGGGGGGGSGSRTATYHAYSPQSAATSSHNLVAKETTPKKVGKVQNSDSDKSYNSGRHNKKGKSFV